MTSRLSAREIILEMPVAGGVFLEAWGGMSERRDMRHPVHGRGSFKACESFSATKVVSRDAGVGLWGVLDGIVCATEEKLRMHAERPTFNTTRLNAISRCAPARIRSQMRARQARTVWCSISGGPARGRIIHHISRATAFITAVSNEVGRWEFRIPRPGKSPAS